jgi:polysaccharide export outer membrane protein
MQAVYPRKPGRAQRAAGCDGPNTAVWNLQGKQQMKNRQRGIAIWAAILGFAVGCASRPVAEPPKDPGPEAANVPYVIGVQDVLRISVWQNDSATVDVPVRPDGKVSVPLIDDVDARGLTPQQLKDVITKKLSKHIVSPDVTVIVLQMNSRFVSVVGRVAHTARVPITQDLRVVEAIALAGGFDEFADTDNIRVVRKQPDGSEVEFHFDYDAYMKGRAPNTNFLLQSGDVVYVPD